MASLYPRQVAWQLVLLASNLVLMHTIAQAQSTMQTPASLTESRNGMVAGPFNGRFLEGGIGLTKHLPEHAAISRAQQSWAMALWFKTDEAGQTALLAGVGTPGEISPRYLALRSGKPVFWAGAGGEGQSLQGKTPLVPGEWHSLAVSVDEQGMSHLYADGAEVATARVILGPSTSAVSLAPVAHGFHHFGGWLANVSLYARTLDNREVTGMSKPEAGLDNLPFEEGSKPWPVQTRASAGMHAPQDPATLPSSGAPLQAGKAVAPLVGNDEPTNSGATLTLRHGWQMADATEVHVPGEEVAASAFDASRWMQATVPGTVLTTLIDRGVYPDPDFGLNNMAIPESLSRKSFWYRNVFVPPASMKGRSLQLTFHGINYRATVWVNGKPVGNIVGAFRHKSFDVTPFVKAGEKTAIAIKIDPPPHPGIAHEQSIAAGSGGNGGMMMLDGPTFGATEGWDWIPGIRDRNIGLWQDVTLNASGAITVEVPQIITKLPLPDRSKADVTVRVPLKNLSSREVRGTVEIAFDDVHLTKAVTVPATGTTLTLAPSEFKQLTVQQPRLWWPNGYGEPDLHTMTITFKTGGKVSDMRTERFGMREITYEISAFDSTGHLRRVEVSPTAAELLGTPSVVDQTHDSFRETPEGWVPTLVPAMERSAALRDLTDLRSAPFMVIRVNGIRIACRGGSWGMDDMRKRVSRERLEPYFRLHREANVNMIRNWMGQDTEDTFFELADEYGMLVWSDFWDSTQDYNLEPTDATLFLDNARDVIARYRNHPSIAVWCGRNEGVPPPTINEGLARLVSEEDGTRYYSADSNKINLHDSGPYKYQEPEDYFTTLSLGFAVEVGLPSPPTLESFQSFLPKEDQWPISDAWAYHDWHQDGNGDVAPFMQTMIDEFGAPTSLADFDRKAQMLNYVGHRAVFEGMNAHLWAPNSGRMLWMTQPAWPSSVWQIFSHDYDTQASFYAVKKAGERVHVQMNLPGHEVVVVNNTEDTLPGMQVTGRVYDLTGKSLAEKEVTVTAAANATSPAFAMELDESMRTVGVVLVKLELKNSNGKPLSENFYWLALSKPGYRRMGEMPAAALAATAHTAPATAGENHAVISLTNSSTTPAIASKLTLVNGTTEERILPAYYSDNYVSLMPGETKTVTIAYPQASAAGQVSVTLRGWNVTPQSVAVEP